MGQRCFFAIYHPPIIWAPTVWLGALNAWLFRHTNCLETAIVAHMIYSAALVLWWLPWGMSADSLKPSCGWWDDFRLVSC